MDFSCDLVSLLEKIGPERRKFRQSRRLDFTKSSGRILITWDSVKVREMTFFVAYV